MASVIMRADGSSTFCPRTPLGILPFSIRRMGYQQRVLHVGNQMAGLLKATRFPGQNGNCNVSTFQYLSLITSNNGYGGYDVRRLHGPHQYRFIRLPTDQPDLTWETQEQLNFGIDARFLNNRLGFEFDWYNKKYQRLAGYGSGTLFLRCQCSVRQWR